LPLRADEEFVKHAPAAQVKLLALLAVKYAALRQVKLSVPIRAVRHTSRAKRTSQGKALLHVPRQRNT